MPRIFDDIDSALLPAPRETLAVSERGDFCVGYFNLRGWKLVDELVEAWPGGTLFDFRELHRAIDEIYRYPLRSAAVEALNRQLRAGIPDADLAKLVISLREDDRLSIVDDAPPGGEPEIICSLGLASPQGSA